jgi:uncharacterized protein (DUF111 family)
MIGWLDCASGASGDMVLGALVDAGVSLDVIAEAVAAVAPEPIALHSERVTRCGFAALRVHVGPEPAPPHRTWLDVRRLLEQAPLAEPVRSRALSHVRPAGPSRSAGPRRTGRRRRVPRGGRAGRHR